MIGKVLRGSRVGGLLHYLFGPGRTNEHQDPHLVGSWDDSPDLLEPPEGERGRRDLMRLAQLLEQPLAIASRAQAKHVWHCALRVAPGDRTLTDVEWNEVAREVVHRTGLAPRDDDGGCRWVAVRHADDHVHLVVTLARQDGARVSTSNDFYKVGEACRWVEQEYGLKGTAARDRTAAKRPTRAESEKATRSRRPEPSRTRLRRDVLAAAAGAQSGAEFLNRLTDAGLLVRERRSEIDPTTITGYAVAIPGDRNASGSPIWYGGGKLASDLSWQKLQRRWSGDATPRSKPKSGHGHVRLSGPARIDAWRRALRAAETGAADIRRLATTDPAAAADAAHATSDALVVVAGVVEGRRGGPLTDAAAAYDRASRELHGRAPRPTPTGSGLRAAARLLATTGRATRDEATQVLALVAALAALTESVAALRDAQGRVAQAAAARDTATRLRNVAPSGHARQPTRERGRSHAAQQTTASPYPAALAGTSRGPR